MDIYGDRGSGKTILLAYFGLKSNLMKIPCVADYKLELPNYVPLKVDELLTLKYTIATIEFDEIDVYLNNRRSMSNLSLFINNVLKQSRKKSLDVLGSTQLFDTIDWRFTGLTNISVIAYGKVDVKGKEYFRYDVVFKSIFGNRIRKLIIPTDFMSSLYEIYDTDEPIMPMDVKEMALEVKDQKALNIEVEKVTNEILSRRLEFNIGEKRVTEKKLHDILLQIEKPESLAFYVSSRLNQKLGFD